jgi:hypothetical protein
VGHQHSQHVIANLVKWLPAALAVASSSALAAPAAGTAGAVTGVVVPPATVQAPPSRHLGFLPPIENPIVELRQYDPLPECFVVLEDGPATEAASTPRTPVTWQLESHSFDPPILPVVTGGTVEIANVGRETHVLLAPGHEGLLPRDPIGPGANRVIEVPGEGEAIRVVSRRSPHLEGRIVPVATRYFSRLDRNGRFRIENVPVGRWTLRVWYRDGWAAMPARPLDVPARDVRIDLTTDALSGKAPPPAPSP